MGSEKMEIEETKNLEVNNIKNKKNFKLVKTAIVGLMMVTMLGCGSNDKEFDISNISHEAELEEFIDDYQNQIGTKTLSDADAEALKSVYFWQYFYPIKPVFMEDAIGNSVAKEVISVNTEQEFQRAVNLVKSAQNIVISDAINNGYLPSSVVENGVEDGYIKCIYDDGKPNYYVYIDIHNAFESTSSNVYYRVKVTDKKAIALLDECNTVMSHGITEDGLEKFKSERNSMTLEEVFDVSCDLYDDGYIFANVLLNAIDDRFKFGKWEQGQEENIEYVR